MTWQDRQTKLKEMLLSVIDSSNLGKTFDIAVYDPIRIHQELLVVLDGCYNSDFIEEYKASNGTEELYTLVEHGCILEVIKKTDPEVKLCPRRQLYFRNNNVEIWTLHEN